MKSRAGESDARCIGEGFARDLSDEALEQTVKYLIQRRDRVDLSPMDREITVENLAVLAAESARRGRASGALDRDAVRTLIREATAGARELAGSLLRSFPFRALDRLTKSTQPFSTPGDLGPSPIHFVFQGSCSRVLLDQPGRELLHQLVANHQDRVSIVERLGGHFGRHDSSLAPVPTKCLPLCNRVTYVEQPRSGAALSRPGPLGRE